VYEASVRPAAVVASHDGSRAAATRRFAGCHARDTLRIERVLANLKPITQQRDPILADPRAVWLDITLSIVELESVTILMKRTWWP